MKHAEDAVETMPPMTEVGYGDLSKPLLTVLSDVVGTRHVLVVLRAVDTRALVQSKMVVATSRPEAVFHFAAMRKYWEQELHFASDAEISAGPEAGRII